MAASSGGRVKTQLGPLFKEPGSGMSAKRERCSARLGATIPFQNDIRRHFRKYEFSHSLGSKPSFAARSTSVRYEARPACLFQRFWFVPAFRCALSQAARRSATFLFSADTMPHFSLIRAVSLRLPVTATHPLSGSQYGSGCWARVRLMA